MTRSLAPVVLALGLVFAPATFGQATLGGAAPLRDLADVRGALAADKRAYVARELGLTEIEAKRFWPIYEGYQRQLDTTVRRSSRLIEELVALDRPLSDAYAKRIAQELAAIDDEETKDRRRVQAQLLRALPPVKALRYLQIEAKAKAIRSYDIASAIPLVQ